VVRFVLPITLFTGGLAGGALVLSVLGGAPLLLALPVDRYITVHQFLVTRFDPFMPVNLAIAFAGDLTIAVTASADGVRTLGAVAAALYLAVMYVSLTRNVPINKWIAAVDPEAVPADWAELDPRKRWSDWNRVRSGLAVAGLLVNVLAVGVVA
jgi:uncharacterized membrane protein